MGISKIGSLFASNVDSVYRQLNSEPKPAERSAEPQPKPPVQPSDAVVYSRSMVAARQQSASAEEVARGARLQQLKEQIARGQYRSDTSQVAVALLKDLV